MAKQHKINGRLMVGKGAAVHYIGEDTKTTHIDKDAAKKHGINAKEFDSLVERGVLTEGDAPAAVVENDEPKPLSAAEYLVFSKAVNTLEEGNEKHWTTEQKPEVAALKEAGVSVTAAQRDELWGIYLEA